MSIMHNYHFNSSLLQFKILFKIIPILLVLILIVVLFVLPFKIPYSFNVPGKVAAAEEWLIIKSRNGPLVTLLKNNVTGISKSYSVTEFERGDDAKFIINPKIVLGGIITKSDTIGLIVSNELELRLASLKGQLDVAYSSLSQNLTGEKESLIKEAKETFDFAVKKVELDKKLYLRQQKLYEKKFISDEEFDISKNNLELDEIAVEVAKAKLQTVLTGGKKEQIDLIKSQIALLEKEISVLEKKSANFHFISPIDGFVKWIPDGDTLLVISDTSSYVISFPIPLIKKKYVSTKTLIRVIHPEGNEKVNVKLQRINSSIEYISYKPVVLASAIIKESHNNLIPGLMVVCKLDCGNITISEHIKRIINSELF